MLIPVDNAVIMAAGTSSRFAPLSYERPKALWEVRGEVLIERQIRQLREAGIREILLVVGYKKEQFAYLSAKFGVELVENPDYLTRNNNGSIWAVRDRLRNSYVCSADDYFAKNPFEREVTGAYYAAVYAKGETSEWCISEGPDRYINSVTVGGRDSWYMMGHTFWDAAFSERFLSLLEPIYEEPGTKGLLWEALYMRHLDVLKMELRRYDPGVIFEFDTFEELQEFDPSYREDSRSAILKGIASGLSVRESEIREIVPFRRSDNEASGIRFRAAGKRYQYDYDTMKMEVLEDG